VSTDEPGKIAENLYAICEESTLSPWTEKDLIYHLKTHEIFSSQSTVQDQFEPLISTYEKPTPIPNQKVLTPEISTIPAHNYGTRSRSTPEAIRETTPATVRTSLMPFTKETTAALSPIELAGPTQTIVPGLMHLTKLYTEDMKYEGSNDSFSLKLDIFHDSCRRACLLYTPEAYKLALPTMLKGQAQDYYYSWRRTWEEQGTDPAEAIC
jgi:hypothetical protein